MLVVSAVPVMSQLSESASIESVSGCAAVVSTTDICTTCVTAACVIEATVTAGCGGCAATAPTIYHSFPCDQGCGGLGCKTIYNVVTATDSVCTAGPTPTQGDSASSTSVSTAGAARVMPFRLW
ncbi:hypothetical protein C8A00DRAFT_13135 [Chaetomidium leptoderma]|uniref:Uncharacterized protein n=1 Tax=Chaetomidium leptoderma TaxID=669021 RepID=A0AAN6VQU0_9PEZI|nr:hypothetical protein C8A00DRAFT_13135 [Chaetomidium leptoderma]